MVMSFCKVNSKILSNVLELLILPRVKIRGGEQRCDQSVWFGQHLVLLLRNYKKSNKWGKLITHKEA
jgi:hypothetical protein